MDKKIGVAAFGNKMRGDDGVGIRIVEELKAEFRAKAATFKNVQFYESGWGGFDVIDRLQDIKGLIVVDAVNMGMPPGTVEVLDIAGLRTTGSVSSHFTDVIQILEIHEQVYGWKPVSKVIGIQFKNLDWGEILSTEIEASIPKAKSYVIRQILQMEEKCTNCR